MLKELFKIAATAVAGPLPSIIEYIVSEDKSGAETLASIATAGAADVAFDCGSALELGPADGLASSSCDTVETSVETAAGAGIDVVAMAQNYSGQQDSGSPVGSGTSYGKHRNSGNIYQLSNSDPALYTDAGHQQSSDLHIPNLNTEPDPVSPTPNPGDTGTGKDYSFNQISSHSETSAEQDTASYLPVFDNTNGDRNFDFSQSSPGSTEINQNSNVDAPAPVGSGVNSDVDTVPDVDPLLLNLNEASTDPTFNTDASGFDDVDAGKYSTPELDSEPHLPNLDGGNVGRNKTSNSSNPGAFDTDPDPASYSPNFENGGIGQELDVNQQDLNAAPAGPDYTAGQNYTTDQDYSFNQSMSNTQPDYNNFGTTEKSSDYDLPLNKNL